GTRPGDHHPPPVGALRAAVRACVPRVPCDQAADSHGERRTGSPTLVRLGRRLLEALRGAAGAIAARARRYPGTIRRGPVAGRKAILPIERSISSNTLVIDRRRPG